MTAVLSAAATNPPETAKPIEQPKPAAVATQPAEAKPTVSVLTSIYRPERDPSEFADPGKAEPLLKRRAELVRKIQDERKRLLKEDTTAKKLNEQIMVLNRKLASLLETKKSMIELNSQLLDLDNAISRLKLAPPPEPETKKKEADKADKAADNSKADKADKADKAADNSKADKDKKE